MTRNAPRSLTVADDRTLARMIATAKRRVVLMAPGFGAAVGDALAERWRLLRPDAVTVIVDVDAEIYRLGYGDFKAFEKLERVAASVGAMIEKQPGVRIGLLIADDETLVFAPTARLVEAGPTKPSAPNAIRLGIPPADVESDVGKGPDGTLARTVGLDKADRRTVEEVGADLEVNPPQKFDIARQVRVFNAFFEFIDFRLKGPLINRKSVRIPADLLGVADASARRKLHAAIRLLERDDELSGVQMLEDRNTIEKRHLRRITGYGLAIKRTEKGRFLAAVERLRDGLERFKEELEAKLQGKLDESREILVEALLPAVRSAPPERWKRSCLYEGEPDAETRLREDLKRAFGPASALIDRMEVRVSFKAVTYESLQDEAFMEAARKAFPELEALHREADMAPPAVDRPAPLRRSA